MGATSDADRKTLRMRSGRSCRCGSQQQPTLTTGGAAPLGRTPRATRSVEALGAARQAPRSAARTKTRRAAPRDPVRLRPCRCRLCVALANAVESAARGSAAGAR